MPNASRRGCRAASTSRASRRGFSSGRCPCRRRRRRTRAQLVHEPARLLAGDPARRRNGHAPVERDGGLVGDERAAAARPRCARPRSGAAPRAVGELDLDALGRAAAPGRRRPPGSGRPGRRRRVRRRPRGRRPRTGASCRGARRAPSSRRASRRAPARRPRRARRSPRGGPPPRSPPRRRPRRPRRGPRRRRVRIRPAASRSASSSARCRLMPALGPSRRYARCRSSRAKMPRAGDEQVGAGVVRPADVVRLDPAVHLDVAVDQRRAARDPRYAPP